MPTNSQGPAAAATDRRLIAYSDARTVYVDRAGRDGDRPPRLVKVFDRGSIRDARREHDAMKTAAGPGVPEVFTLTDSDLGGHPSLETAFAPGIDGETWMAEHGPMPGSLALQVGEALATILHRLSAIRSAAAPRGLVHGDVKPGNLMIDVDRPATSTVRVQLIDFEHASAHSTAEAFTPGSFTGGTPGFAPPEAERGAMPTTAFDAYGFGWTLRFLVTGERPTPTWPTAPTRCWRAVPTELRRLIDHCTHRDPAARRSDFEALATDCADLAVRLSTTPELVEHESLRLAVLAAKLSTAQERLAEARGTADADLLAWSTRRLRLLQRVRCVTAPQTTEPAGSLAPRARTLTAWLTRFPADAAAQSVRTALLDRCATAWLDQPEQIRDAERNGNDLHARAIATGARADLRACLRLARQLPLPDDGGAAAATLPAHFRAPFRVLDQADQRLEAAMARIATWNERMATAEAAIDLGAVQETVDAVAGAYGGASPITAQFKQRAHEYEFALSEIAGSANAVDACHLQLSKEQQAAFEPLRSFVRSCVAQDNASGPISCRRLLKALEDAIRSRPSLSASIAPPLNALRGALEFLTDDCWERVVKADASLQMTPVPIRPLQSELNRIDRLDMEGLLIDRPNRTRAAMLDMVEGVRSAVERARAVRDRLARGAEEALDKGHLTTGLFELERVANQFDDETGRTQGEPLQERYEEAKRLKLEVERMARINNELAARVAALGNDAANGGSDGDALNQRATLLLEREQALEFLAGQASEHRRATYAADLAALRFERFELASAAAERNFERGASLTSRAELARQTARELGVLIPAQGWTPEQIDTVRESVTRWRQRADQARAASRSGWRRVLGLFRK